MSVTVTTHERPGVYSVYDASGLVRSGGRKNVALIAKSGSEADGTKVSEWYTYAQAVEEATAQEVAAAAKTLQLHTVYFLRGAK